MNEIEYWRFKARLVEIEMEIERCRGEWNSLLGKKMILMQENGLEIGKNYRFHDETLSIEEVK